MFLCAAACSGQNMGPPQDLRQTALALEQQGDNTGAESAWNAFLKLHPTSSEACAHLGLLEARQGHYKEAIPFYRKAIELHSPIPELRLNLGLACFKTGDMKCAVQQFMPLLKSAPQSSPQRQRLTILAGMSYYGLAEYARAAPLLRDASDRDPQNLPLLLALAHSYLWTRQYRDVMTTYRQILVLNPNSAEADMLAGEALDELKDANGAIEQFRAAAQADPKMPDVHFGLGYLLWTKRQYEDAVPEFLAELENNSDHAQALTYLADCDIHLSRPEAAAPLLEKAIRLDPRIQLAHLDLGQISADAGREDDALREFIIAERLDPNDVDVHWRLGRLYRSLGKKDLAKAEFEKAKSITQAADTALIHKMSSHTADAPASAPARK